MPKAIIGWLIQAWERITEEIPQNDNECINDQNNKWEKAYGFLDLEKILSTVLPV